MLEVYGNAFLSRTCNVSHPVEGYYRDLHVARVIGPRRRAGVLFGSEIH